MTTNFAANPGEARENVQRLPITKKNIALDDQPIVENTWFCLLSVLELSYETPSSHHITITLLSKLHSNSFTADIWTSSISPISFIDLAAQTHRKSTDHMLLSLTEQKQSSGNIEVLKKPFQKRFHTCPVWWVHTEKCASPMLCCDHVWDFLPKRTDDNDIKTVKCTSAGRKHTTDTMAKEKKNPV